jgi:tetratricopeptide (TPR) repeat protein
MLPRRERWWRTYFVRGENRTRWIQDNELLKISFVLLACTSFAAAIVLLAQTKPQGTAALGLLVWAGLCIVLATGGINIIRRIQRIGPGGIEIKTWENIDRLLSVPFPSWPRAWWERPNQEEIFDPEGPLAVIPLNAEQSWFYERGTNLIFHLQHSDLDYETLSKQELGKYRELVLWIGTAAINESRPGKALNILKLLESFEDKPSRELFALGAAYFWESVREEGNGRRRTYLEEIQGLLKAACEQDDTNPVAFWILGWVYDELGLCEKSIEANQKTLALDPRFAPWAYWTIAVSQLNRTN